MNLNKEFLSEVIKYLINRGVTLTDVLDTFNEHFNTSDTNAIKYEHEKHDEVRKPITDIDLLLCGRSVEESSTPCATVDSNRDLCQKVKEKYFDWMAKKRDLYFFLGTTQRHHNYAKNPFIIIGAFYPPKIQEDAQLSLF